eukprot:1984162-Ditylum_brightwellii.AAC.1
MRVVIGEVGMALHEKYYWVPESKTIYLYMDNAGGHGTDETVDWCVKLLKDKYNVKNIHKILRSPETNILDLGIWMAIQSVVERFHVGKGWEKD